MSQARLASVPFLIDVVKATVVQHSKEMVIAMQQHLEYDRKRAKSEPG
ncbi:hypothetical protein [Microbacterium sp.]